MRMERESLTQGFPHRVQVIRVLTQMRRVIIPLLDYSREATPLLHIHLTELTWSAIQQREA